MIKKIISLITVMSLLLTVCSPISIASAGEYYIPSAGRGDIINGYVDLVEIIDCDDGTEKTVAEVGDTINVWVYKASMFGTYDSSTTEGHPNAGVLNTNLIFDEDESEQYNTKEGGITWTKEDLSIAWRISGTVNYINTDITEARNCLYKFNVFWTANDYMAWTTGSDEIIKTRVATISIPLANPNMKLVNPNIEQSDTEQRFYLDDDNVKDISIYDSGSCSFILDNNGYVYRDTLKEGSSGWYPAVEMVEGLPKIRDVESNGLSVFFVTEDDEIYALGSNYNGQLGLGTDYTNRSTPVKLDTSIFDGKVKQIAMSTYSSIFLTDSGTVYATGLNDNGQLGLGDTNIRNTPEKITSLPEKIVQVSMGEDHTFLVGESGIVYATGLNDNGQLGLGDTNNRNTPEKITAISGVKKAQAGSNSSIFLTNDGDVYGVGKNYYGELGLGDNSIKTTLTKINVSGIKDIVLDESTTFLLTEYGQVYGTGSNSGDILGLGDSTKRNNPTLIEDLAGVDKIFCGGYSAFLKDGKVYISAWGKSYWPTKTSDTIGSLTRLSIPKINQVININTSGHVDFVLNNDDNSIDESTFKYAFDKKGETEMKSFDVNTGIDLYPNFDGEYKLRIYAKANMGENISKAYTVNVIEAPNNPPSIKMFSNRVVGTIGGFLISDNTGSMHGLGEIIVGDCYGDTLGGSTTFYGIDINGIIAVENGLLLTVDGEVYVSGDNTYGELGLGVDGSSNDKLTKLEGIPKIEAIVSNECHSLLLSEDGEVYAMGDNGNGQLGLGDMYYAYYFPTKIEGLPKIKAIDVGAANSLLLSEDGEVYAMGSNNYGQLGLGDNTERNTPTKLNITNVKAIAADGNSTMFLTESGEVYATGRNEYGQLGLGDKEDRNTLTKVDISGIEKIYSHWSSVFYLINEAGEVYSMGYDETGGLGLGDIYETNIPMKIEGISGVESMAVTDNVVLLTKSGEVYGMGLDWRGYFGFGEVVLKTPTKFLNITPNTYPKSQGLLIIDEAIDEIQWAKYAFVSQATLDENSGEVPNEMWKIFNPKSPSFLLNPTSNGEYYLYVQLKYRYSYADEACRNNETHEVKFGPFEVTDVQKITSMDSYSYVAGDIHVMDRMSAEFNLSFVPSQNMTLGNTDVTFSNCFTADKLNIELLDKNGNVLNTSNKWVSMVYKNGVRVSDITTNYVFKKRDEGSEKDNVYQFRILIGNDVINRQESKTYQIRFNELKGISVDGTNQVVSVNALPSTMMVYVTELMDVT